MNFRQLFPNNKPLIGCIHLMPLPGSPGYCGNISKVLNQAIKEADIYNTQKVDGLIIENFGDIPFYKDKVPAETIASMTVVTQKIKEVFKGPVGVNVLRNDAQAAMAIAVATQADFIRVNVHIGAAVTDQGIIEGKAYDTLRLRKNLNSDVLIFADVAVKHASNLAKRSIEDETLDLTKRGMADVLIVSGCRTGGEPDIKEINRIKQNTNLPVIIGSGMTIENLNNYYPSTDGFIVGSYFKRGGKAQNVVDKIRVTNFMEKFRLCK